MKRTILALMGLFALAFAGMAAAGVIDPALQLLGMSPDAMASGLMLANGPLAIPKQTITEQIAAFTAKLQAAQDKVTALVQKSIDDGRTLDEHEQEERATAAAEIKAINDHLAILKDHEALMVQRVVDTTAQAVPAPRPCASGKR